MEVKKKGARGFTLIEMLLVVAILVALAVMIIPKLDKEQLRSNKGIAASNMGGLSRYIQLYYTRHNVYPDRWDSLMQTGGSTLWQPGAPGSGVAGIDPQLTGGPPDGSPHKLTVSTALTELEARSLTRIGLTTVLDAPASPTGLPGNAFNIQRTLTQGEIVATINTADGDGKGIIDSIYPENKLSTGVSGTLPAGKKLVVFGFGPVNTAVGDVMQECPAYTNTDSTQYYNRLLCIFEIDTGGGRAQLKKVVGGDADRIDEEIADYYEK